MPTAKKLPSGSWRCRVYSHTEEIEQPDGTKKEKKVYKSFTCDDPSAKGKRKCEAMAAAWAENKENHSVSYSSMTYGQALDEYIKIKSNVLSPGTIREYKRARKNDMQSLVNMRLDLITNIDIQKAVNAEAGSSSPKTVRNKYGLVTAVLNMFRPDFKVKVQLPQKEKPKYIMPSHEDIRDLIKQVEGTPMELPIYLAINGPLRRGEICALDSDHINGNIVHVAKSMVQDTDGNWIIKRPKTTAGDRYITFPSDAVEKFKGINGRVTDLTPTAITHRFQKLVKKNGYPHFRFHDLRHYSASLQVAAGVPLIYIQDRCGWETDYPLKHIYGHALEEERKNNNNKINEKFASILSESV